MNRSADAHVRMFVSQLFARTWASTLQSCSWPRCALLEPWRLPKKQPPSRPTAGCPESFRPGWEQPAVRFSQSGCRPIPARHTRAPVLCRHRHRPASEEHRARPAGTISPPLAGRLGENQWARVVPQSKRPLPTDWGRGLRRADSLRFSMALAPTECARRGRTAGSASASASRNCASTHRLGSTGPRSANRCSQTSRPAVGSSCPLRC